MDSHSKFIAELNETQREILEGMKGLGKKIPVGHCMDAEIMRQLMMRNAPFLQNAPTSSSVKPKKKRGPYIKKNIS